MSRGDKLVTEFGMAILLGEPHELLEVEALPHKTWTRDEVKVLQGTGLFDGLHYELIEGELIDKMGKLRPHVIGLRKTAETLEAVFGREFVEREAPIDIAEGDNPRNEPEPDVVVLRRPYGEFSDNPRPSDICLIVEVADSTLRNDRTTKARLYARAGIPEYWVLDLNGRRLLVFREPQAGAYGDCLEFGEAASVGPLNRPDDAVAVASLLP